MAGKKHVFLRQLNSWRIKVYNSTFLLPRKKITKLIDTMLRHTMYFYKNLLRDNSIHFYSSCIPVYFSLKVIISIRIKVKSF